ncbi:MAG: hypothetical protein RLZZ316_842 [Bacteroidota bacterium]|jgi:hypothetical protein
MKIHQQHLYKGKWINKASALDDGNQYQLVLVFGAAECIAHAAFYEKLKQDYPKADIVISSTSGEIAGDTVYDDSAVVTAISFNKTTCKAVVTQVQEHANSFETGQHLLKTLQATDLSSVFVISDGTKINGSELVMGFNEDNVNNIPITGGLAGDAARFIRTLVGLNSTPTVGNVVAVGFYGKNLKLGHGSFGGWDEFGHERNITKSDKNVLFEIDGRNALDLYKEYLGPYVDELPGSALLFPLSAKLPGATDAVVRTILSVDENDKSMTFAGNLPEGSKVRLMKANFDKLIEGSSTAAQYSFENITGTKPDLAILISCVGRKLVLQERVDEEVEAAKAIFGEGTAITGFYSYGEISPFNPSSRCELHNQTMTITTFSEY